jgi:hypothetical protein
MRWCLVILLFAPAWCAAQPLSFKGLTLGMTRSQVDQLLRASRWCNSMDSESDRLGDRESAFLGADGYLLKRLPYDSAIVRSRRRALDTFSLWACESGSCFGFDQVHVVFSSNSDTGRLLAMSILSPPFEVNQTSDVRMYMLTAYAALVRLYGQPTELSNLFEPINTGSMAEFASGSRRRIADWVWLRGERGAGAPPCGVSLSIGQAPIRRMAQVKVFVSSRP